MPKEGLKMDSYLRQEEEYLRLALPRFERLEFALAGLKATT